MLLNGLHWFSHCLSCSYAAFNQIESALMQKSDRENKAIEFLMEYSVTKQEFDALGRDLAAALSIVSYACSEVNVLMRLYLFSIHDPTGKDVVDSMGEIQKNTLLRVWSAKLFEFAEFLELKKRSETDNEMLRDLSASARKLFTSLEEDSAYKAVMAIRHEATSHYTLSAARKNLKHLGDNAALSIVQHKMGGNSFNPLGEEVMFIGRMNRAANKCDTKEDKIKFHNQWFDWNVRATKWLGKVQAEFVKCILFDKYPDRKARKQMYWIPQQMVGEIGESKIPLFCRAHEYNRRKERKT